MVPYSEAKVFRTKTGFVIRDKEDDDWCKFVPFDDIDKLQTEIACKNLDPIVIQAMDAMPIPELTSVPPQIIEELKQDIENAYKEEHPLISIDTIGSSADIPHMPSPSSILTREDLIQHQFGSLAPYIDDYTRETYEIEENHTTHLPRLVQAKTRTSRTGPLSYQKTVLKEDPITTENFENRRRPRSNSLYCSGTSEQGSDNEEEEEDEEEEDSLPTSLEPSAMEEVLFRAEELNIQSDILSKKTSEDIDEFEATPEYEELTDWEIIKNSLPENLITNSLFTFLFMLVLAIGAFAQLNIYLITTLCAPLNYFGIEAMKGLKLFLSSLFQNIIKKHGRRQQFTNQQGRTTRRIHDLKKPPFKQKKNQPRIQVNPMEGIQLNKPEGIAGSHKKTKKTYHIQPVKISEARIVKLADKRHYFIVKFFDSVKRMALYDNGAACCTIHPRFLEELRQHGHVPIEEGNFNIEGFIPNKTRKTNQVAYLDFKLETGHLLKNIPFIIIESNYDVLIGNNLVRAHRWANCWKNSDFYLSLIHI